MKKSPLSKLGKSDSAKAKREIQGLLRQIVIRRDGGCVLRNYSEAGACGGWTKDGELILQAEHLNSRERSVSFGDTRNVVCLCKNHHIFFKKRHGALYWDLIRQHIGEERWAWFKGVSRDQKSYPMSAWDWEKVILGLRQELRELGVV